MNTFKQWLKVQEVIQPAGQATPNQTQAADMVVNSLDKVPLQPGQKVTDLISSPQGQKQIIKGAALAAKQSSKPLDLTATANVIDASAGMK